MLTLPNTDLRNTADCNSISYIDLGVPKVLNPNQAEGTEADVWFSLDCSSSDQGLELVTEQNATASAAGVDSPSGCLNQINDEPIGSSVTINLGSSACVETASGIISYFKCVRDYDGDAQIVVSGWTRAS